MPSYTSQRTTLRALLSEAKNLHRSRVGDVPGRVAAILQRLRDLEDRLRKDYDFKLQDRDILDVGAGQFLVQMYFFAQKNRGQGIDYDVIAQGWRPGQYFRMLKFNGPRRTLKTLVRKLVGVDAKYRTELMRQLQVDSLPQLNVQQMDACALNFADQSFDLVHSYSVFHHLSNPEAALRGITRILRPGGMVYISLHLYTSETGSLDSRFFAGRGHEIPHWAHLRPEHVDKITSNAYVNKLRLGEWEKLFQTCLPGAQIIRNRTSRPGVEEDAKQLLTAGELSAYKLEELITHELVVLWKKS